MKISIVIATLHRSKDLQILFESLSIQTKTAEEVIVIDQSDDDETKTLCMAFRGNIPLHYYHCSVKSAAYCRNLGVDKSKGEVIAFLDDDTKVEPDYVESIEAFYREYPDAMGGMSRIINYREFRENLLGKGLLYGTYKTAATLFGLNSFKKGFIVLKSSRNIDHYESEKAMEAQWLSTCNCWMRREIFDEFRFEEKFKKWSFGEDRMWSYRIYKRYPGSLYFYPRAALYHFESARNRMIEEDKILMKVTYQFWFFHACMKGNSLFYWWANAGEILLHLLNAFLGREPFINTWYYIKANIKLLLNMRIIREGNLSFT